MQIIDKNSFNVRSAVYRLSKPDTPLEFILLPMIHVGSKTFYHEVRQQLLKCDLILTEGVQSRKTPLLTMSYRIVSRMKRLDLVTQQEALKLSDLSDKIIHSDMPGKTFDAHWDNLPKILRIQLMVFLPIYIVYFYLFGTKDLLAEHLAIDDLASRDEMLNYDEEFAKLDSLIVDKRDQIVLKRIDHVYQTNRHQEQVVGIVFGARHMRNIIRHLSEKLGYRIVDSQWLTVFDL